MTVHRTKTSPFAVEADGLGKRFGDRWALRDVDLPSPAARSSGCSVPTAPARPPTVRILTTLLAPDAGRARVAGHDVVARRARQSAPLIGLAGQQATVDELLTGRANLEMVGRLYHLPRRTCAPPRGGAAGPVRAYRRRRRTSSRPTPAACAGGWTWPPAWSPSRRSSSSMSPPPAWTRTAATSCGLSCATWCADGTTIVLTTQYLEEADHLADHIVVVDHGRAIAQGTPPGAEGHRSAGQRGCVAASEDTDLAPARPALDRCRRRALGGRPRRPAHHRRPRAGDGIVEAVRALDAAGVPPTTSPCAVRPSTTSS